MSTIGIKTPVDVIKFIKNNPNISWNLSAEELVNITLKGTEVPQLGGK